MFQMKNIFILLVLALLIGSCKSQQPSPRGLDPIVQRARETSLYTAKVDWREVDGKFKELTKGATTPEEMKPGLEFLLNSLGDKHGTFRSSKDYSLIAWYTGKTNTPDNRDADFVNDVINDISAKFSYQLLMEDIGYLKVVGIGPDKTIKEHADFIRNGVKDLARQGANRWILDLRTNGGGNMNPMIAGLAPLIGDGLIGGAVDAQGELVREYQIREGQFFDSENLVCEMDNLPVIANDAKVVVLLSRYTVSSGELVAVAFKGRKNTLFIGENSGGFTTGNGYDPIHEDLVMVISQSVYSDRNGAVYHEAVGVDIPMEFVPTDKKLEDLQILKAIEWLEE